MTPSIPAQNSRYTEQERGHWRFVDQGVRWTTLGVSLMGISVLVMLLMSIAVFTITIPQNAGAGRGVAVTSGLLYTIATFVSLGSSLLGLIAVMIGLALCSFTPRPSFARYLAIGSLVMLIWSHASFGRGMLMQMNVTQMQMQMQMGQRIPSFMGGSMYEQFSVYFMAFSEYLLAIILGCCFLLAVAQEFSDQELVRSIQGYLKLLFFVPLAVIVIGFLLVLLASLQNAWMAWIPIVAIVLAVLIYCWMASSLAQLLRRMHWTLQTEIDPRIHVTIQKKSPPPVIDPLAD